MHTTWGDEDLVLGMDVGLRNLALCVCERSTMRIDKWILHDCFPDEKLPTTSACIVKVVNDLKDLLHGSLSEYVPNIRTVAIEAQPFGMAKASNNKMRAVQAAIEATFALMLPQVTVQTVSPQAKRCEGDNYAQRKADAIRQVAQHLQEMPGQPSEIFETSAKKDDLADSFLVARAVVLGKPPRRRKRPRTEAAPAPTTEDDLAEACEQIERELNADSDAHV
jgi:hypothetical protein